MKRLGPALLAAGIALAALAWMSGTAPRALWAGLLLADIAQAPTLLARVTPRPERRTVTWTEGATALAGDLYLPGEPARAGLVLVPGADRSGKDHPRLVALAEALARVRFLVLVPDIAANRVLAIDAADRHPIAAAARWLADVRHQPRVGILAISYALMPTVAAALDEPAAIDFVLGIGGGFDATALLTFATTGAFRPDPGQAWTRRVPNPHGAWVFVQANRARLPDSGDRALLHAIGERRRVDPDAPVADLAARLTPQGAAVLALLDNRDPDRVPALIAGLPPAIRSALADLDLAGRDLSGLRARLILVHGTDDPVVPWTESLKLAGHAPDARLFLVSNLAHVDWKPAGWSDLATLGRAGMALMEEQDAPP